MFYALFACGHYFVPWGVYINMYFLPILLVKLGFHLSVFWFFCVSVSLVFSVSFSFEFSCSVV